MTIRLFGAILTFAACSSFGFRLAASHRTDMLYLKSLISILDFMECELNYRLTPLPALCRQAAAEHKKTLGPLFEQLAAELDAQVSPSVEACLHSALHKTKPIPRLAGECLSELGCCLGKYTLEGQLMGLKAVRASCRQKYEELNNNKDARLRSYQALGLCTGAALAILLI